MKNKSILYSIIIINVLLFFSCHVSGINRNWTGTCLTTVVNDGVQVEYQGIVESFSFHEDGVCSLLILDSSLGGSTYKSYVGTYDYDSYDYSLSYSLTLEQIDDIPVSPNMEYDLTGSDTFNMENDSGNLTAEISGGDIPPSVEIDVVFSLTAE